jgi:hypothetical protein
VSEHTHTTLVPGCYRCDLNKDEMHEQVKDEFKIGDKIAAAVLTYKRAALRVGVIEKIHPPTGSIPETRFTIRDENGKPCVVSSARSVHLERDEHHTMAELYEYRMVYNAFTAMWYDTMHGKAVKSWNHHDGEPCFGGGWFMVAVLTPDGWATNHYKAEHWDLFDVEEHPRGPKWDGHTPAEALTRLKKHLAAVGSA